MQTEGHTVFSGPLKHQGKEDVEHAQGEVYVKNDHPNSHHVDGKHIAKVMNEDDHKRKIFLTQLLLCLMSSKLQYSKVEKLKGGTNNSSQKQFKLKKLIYMLGKQENKLLLGQ